MKELLMHYDSMMPDIVDKINELLKPYGVSFVDDNAEYDGFIRYELVEPAYDHERENGKAYAAELDKAAGILQHVHPAGECKAIGRLEVAIAMAEVIENLTPRLPDCHEVYRPEMDIGRCNYDSGVTIGEVRRIRNIS